MESKEVSGSQAIAYRNYRRARDRALVRLANLYPNVYKNLLAEERENDKTEGKTWVASNSRISVSVGARTRTKHKRAASRRPHNRGKTRHNGGKA